VRALEYQGSIMKAMNAMNCIGSFMVDPWLGGSAGVGRSAGERARETHRVVRQPVRQRPLHVNVAGAARLRHPAWLGIRGLTLVRAGPATVNAQLAAALARRT
jgi:hypothetical protein